MNIIIVCRLAMQLRLYLLFKNNIMQRLLRQAENYCKNLNKSVQASYEYNEAMLYAKFGGSIGIGKCSEIAQKYCA